MVHSSKGGVKKSQIAKFFTTWENIWRWRSHLGYFARGHTSSTPSRSCSSIRSDHRYIPSENITKQSHSLNMSSNLLASNNSVAIKLSLVVSSQAVFNLALVNLFLFSMMVTEKATLLTTSSILLLSSCFPEFAEAYRLLHHDKLPPHPEQDHLRSI